MSGFELGQADALIEGDTLKADAMALKDAMDGAGTDEKAINAVYARIRDEVEAEAASTGMKTAEVEAEIKRRNDEVKHTYGATFAHGDNSALEADFHSEMQGGELNLALGNMNADRTAMDAAESRSSTSPHGPATTRSTRSSRTSTCAPTRRSCATSPSTSTSGPRT